MTGVFRDPEGALRASEQLSKLECVGSLRLYLPGADGDAVETLVVEERSPWMRLGLFGGVIGAIAAYVSMSITPSWILAIVALAAGVGAGVLLGSWLGGQRYRRPVRPHMRVRYLDLVKRGKSILLADVRTQHDAEAVREVMEENGAYVSEGHWPVGDGSTMLPAQ